MKFSISQSELQNALSIVLKGISNRSTLPILSGIYIESINDSLLFQSTDLDLSIQYRVSALIEEEGRIVVPGKLFFEITKNLSDTAVHFETLDDIAVITCDSSSFSIKTLSADDFPGFPHVDIQHEISIPFDCFSSMIKKVARVVSKDESRAILTGVLISFKQDILKMVATDSYRLALVEENIDIPSLNEFEVVISGSFLTDITTLPKSNKPIRIAIADNQILITYQNIVFINRRIEGNFPNYQQLLPDSYSTRIKIDLNHLRDGVKRTSLLSQSSSPIKFDIELDTQTLQLSANSQDIGMAQETISCECEGENVEIAFNYSYVLDGLSSIDSEQVYLEIQSSMKPGIFKSADKKKFLYLVMPVRLS